MASAGDLLVLRRHDEVPLSYTHHQHSLHTTRTRHPHSAQRCSCVVRSTRARRQAVQSAAAELHRLAGSSDVPQQADAATGLPSLPTLPDDAAVLASSGASMLVLLQALCERGQPELCIAALHSCYLDVTLAPFEVVWLALQACVGPPRRAVARVALGGSRAAPPPARHAQRPRAGRVRLGSHAENSRRI
eukprot:3408233-Prymnesium_polylepis.1